MIKTNNQLITLVLINIIQHMTITILNQLDQLIKIK
jgi:hypothetical protein